MYTFGMVLLGMLLLFMGIGTIASKCVNHILEKEADDEV